MLLTFVGTLAFWALGIRWGDRDGFVESLWQAFVIAIGKGVIDDANWTQRISSIFFIFLALFLAGSLVGLLVSAINQRLDVIRRGRSRVLERQHTLVLGSSPRLTPVLDELLADPHDRGPVVVLAERDKTDMEDDFLARHRKPGRKVVFRTGTPARRADLELVGVNGARSVIVLNTGSDVDAVTVRRSLAANSFSDDSVHVVSEMSNRRVARSLRESTRGLVATVCIDAAVGDMLAQAVRSPGLAAVFDELLSFEGSELYVVPQPDSGGSTWYEMASGLGRAVALGYLMPDGITLTPDPESAVPTNARLVVLSSGPDVTWTAGEASRGVVDVLPEQGAVSVMVLGFSRVGEMMLHELDGFLAAGSQVRVLADTSMLSSEFPSSDDFRNEVVFSHTKHDPDEIRSVLDAERPDVLVVLGYLAGLDEEEADALTLLTLHTLNTTGSDQLHRPRIVAQMLNNELGALAESGESDDYVVTDALVSRMLVHTARERHLSAVFGELFDADGPAIALLAVADISIRGSALRDAFAQRGWPMLGVLVDGVVTLTPDLERVWTLGANDRVVVLQP